MSSLFVDPNRTVKNIETFYTSERSEWRKYLADHFETSNEIWFVFPVLYGFSEIFQPVCKKFKGLFAVISRFIGYFA